MTTFVQPPCAPLTRYVIQLLRFSILFASWGVFCAPAPGAEEPNESRHVVIVVWDGMRPDFVSEENTPALWKLAREGVTFRNHHAVYPSATEVNGVAIATGVYPGRNGIIANYQFRPEIDNRKMIHSEDRAILSKGDQLSGGKYIALPTIDENVRASGLTSFVSAAKPVGLLLDRHELISLGDAVWVLGPSGGFAQSDKAPAAERDRQAVNALTDALSREKPPRF